MEDRRLVTVSRLFYEQQLSKTEIAQRLQMSITHVNRLLKEAIRSEIVRITIQPPNNEGLELALKEKYRLVDAAVIAVPEEPGYLRSELGRAAAAYFAKNVRNGHTVGIGSGRTIFEMVGVLDEEPRDIALYPLAVIAQQDLKVNSIDANTAVNITWFKSRPDAEAYRIELFFPEEKPQDVDKKTRSLKQKRVVERFIDQASDLDFYFFSCSQLRKDSQLIEIAQSCGVLYKDLEKLGIIGDFLFSTIDKDGNAVSTCIDAACVRVDLKSLKKASSDKGKRVILIAGGKEKFPVIRSGIDAGLFNVLITDVETAEALLSVKR